MVFRKQFWSCAQVGLADQVRTTLPRQAVMKERPYRLPRRLAEQTFILVVSHQRISIGVASLPRNTTSNR